MISTVTVTGTILDASQEPLSGEVIFTPSTGATDAGGNPILAPITDASGLVVIAMTGVTEQLNRGTFSAALVPTNTAGLNPIGWLYQVTINNPGIPAYGFTCFIPSSPNPVDLSQLVPAQSVAAYASYLPLTGGALSGLLVLGNGLQIPAGAAAGDVLTSDSAGNAAWQPNRGDKNYTQAFNSAAVINVTHNLGKYPAVTVMDTAGDWMFGDVDYLTPNSLTVTFAAPTSGTVICN